MKPSLQFERQLANAWPPSKWRDITIVLDISGGSDSIALLRGLVSLRNPASQGQLIAAHFNHQLRNEESDADERFVKEICNQLGVNCRVGVPAGKRAANSKGLEAWARAERYRFFEDVTDQVGARYLVMAHTANDQAETILHRVVRGTGLAGLAGIPAIRPLNRLTTIVRPMLSIFRNTIVDYLDEIDQPFRHDSSNDNNIFTRNRIRNELIPQLEQKYNPRVIDSLSRLGQIAEEAQTVIEDLVLPLLDQVVTIESPNHVTVNCRVLGSHPNLLVRELFVCLWKKQRWPLRDMGHEQWSQLANFACYTDGDAVGQMLPGGIQPQRTGATVELQRDLSASTDLIEQ